jgi:Tol biopolymer transport system component
VREVAFRPDGGAILFTELDSSGSGQPESKLMLFERATGAVRPFRGPGLSGSSPRWSPNGERVALLGAHEGAFGLVVTDARGGSERLVAKVEGTNHPLPSSGEFIA